MNAELETSPALSERAVSVLHAAEKLFLQYGYEATSLEMVIKESGGSRRIIYDEFGNKQQLFKAAVLSKVSQVKMAFEHIAPNLSVEETLIDVCQRFLTTMMAPETLVMFKLLISTVERLPDIGHSVYQEGPKLGIEPLAQYLAKCKREGTLDIDNPTYACQLLLGMVKEPMHVRAMLEPSYQPTEQEIEQHVTRAVKIFLNGTHVC